MWVRPSWAQLPPELANLRKNGTQLWACQGGFEVTGLRKDAETSSGRNYAAALAEHMHGAVHRQLPLCGGTRSGLLGFIYRGCRKLRGAPTARGSCTASSSQL